MEAAYVQPFDMLGKLFFLHKRQTEELMTVFTKQNKMLKEEFTLRPSKF